MRSTVTTGSHICAMHRPVTRWKISRPTKSTAPFRKYPDCMERYMKPKNGSPPLYLASSATEKTPVTDSEQRLHSVLATLEQSRAILIDSSLRETASLVSVAILELRMKLNRIADCELKALCDAMDQAEAASQQPKAPKGLRRRPQLELVK